MKLGIHKKVSQNVFGQIVFHQVKETRALRRFAEKQIKAWILRRALFQSSGPTSYQVDFSREGTGPMFNCQIKVFFGSKVWKGQNYRNSIHQALIDCLTRGMAPVFFPLSAPAMA